MKLNDILDYLIEQGGGKYKYIIEIKNSGDLGKEGVDILYSVLQEKGIIDKVVFGTFHKEVSEYVDEKYPDLARSTSIAGTAQMINYAHKHNMAVQYWTVNDEEDMKYLIDMGADCIMTDYPDKLYEVKYAK